MHFNRNELLELATRPSHDFNKEGILIFLERPEGFFKRNDVIIERWCRLRGNMLFYFKSSDHCSDPVGTIMLENFHINDEEAPNIPFSFSLVFEGNSHILAALTSTEKINWINVLQRASFTHLKGQIDTLLQHIKINQKNKLVSLQKYRQCTGTTIDLCKPPLVEMSLSCDNLRCSASGKPPNPRISIYVMKPPHNTWILYAQTEIADKTSNPTFLTTLTFRMCDGIDTECRLCFIITDVRERLTDTTVHLGKTMIDIQDLLEAGKTRLFLLSPYKYTVGFLSINTWYTEANNRVSKCSQATPSHQSNCSSPVPFTHRRTQSLPPKLSFMAKFPSQGSLKLLYENPSVSTFRFHSGLGGDISAMEIMAEPILSFKFPQHLLRLWINEERLSQEELTSLGDLKEEWSHHQQILVTQHSTLISMYGIALGTLQTNVESGVFFKKSIEKEERALEFAPLNLHLQRLFAQNDSLRRSEFYDTLTVGAFCANSLGFKKGGLYNMLQTLESMSPGSPKGCFSEHCSSRSDEMVDILRRLRKEVLILLRLVVMAVRNKDIAHMLRLIDQLEAKVDLLLRIIDPSLIVEAFKFLDKIRNPQNSLTVASRGSGKDIQSPTEGPDMEKSFEEMTKVNSYRSKLEEKEDFNVNCCYKSTDEPEPWDLIQLNIRASLICLSSKVRNYCQRLQEKNVESRRESLTPTTVKSKTCNNEMSSPEDEDSGISVERGSTAQNQSPSKLKRQSATNTPGCQNGGEKDEGIEELNRFRETDSIDWIQEIHPSMKKLRHAIDELTRTSRLTNSVFRLKESPERGELNYSIKYRRDICFSQALTSVVTGLLTKIWCRRSDSHFASILTKIGPLVQFEVLLSCFQASGGRLADMIIAIEDLRSVEFVMVPEGVFTQSGYDRAKDSPKKQRKIPCPRVAGTRNSLRVVLPIPEQMLSLFPHFSKNRTLDPPSFKITPVLFNVGINEEASLAAKMNLDGAQFRYNHANFDRLFEYFHNYKTHFIDNQPKNVSSPTLDRRRTSLSSLMSQLHDEIFQQKSKNVSILQLASKVCRYMQGLRFTSCKSAKDRTGMSVTLEEIEILREEFDLSEAEVPAALNCIRQEGTRRENCEKNTGHNRYAFSSIQLALFPQQYKPPAGSYGARIT